MTANSLVIAWSLSKSSAFCLRSSKTSSLFSSVYCATLAAISSSIRR